MSADKTTLTDRQEILVSPLIKQFQSLTISFENINYRIKSSSFWNSIPTKQILDDVSGRFPPGMNAILGLYSNLFRCFFS